MLQGVFFGDHRLLVRNVHIADRLCSNVCPDIAEYTPPIARYASAIRTAAMIIKVNVSYRIFLIISRWGVPFPGGLATSGVTAGQGRMFKEVIMPECFYAASQTYS